MTSNGSPSPAGVRRPGAGVAIDRVRLLRLRQERLLSRARLAELMSDPEPRGPDDYSITPDAIAKIENGWRNPKIATLDRLCIALDCRPGYLLVPASEDEPGDPAAAAKPAVYTEI